MYENLTDTFNRAPVHTPMIAKAAVLARNHGERKVRGDVCERHPVTRERCGASLRSSPE